MPIILQSDKNHPFLPSRGNPSVMDAKRAAGQDIRPLHIAFVNLMANKERTESEICIPLGRSSLQIHLTFVLPTTYYNQKVAGDAATANNDKDHLRDHYVAFDSIGNEKFDGLIVTGYNGREAEITDEALWPDLKNILDWSRTHVTSSLFLCLASQAGLGYFHGIKRVRSAQKMHGVFDHEVVRDSTGLLLGFSDLSPLPVSRWNEIPADKVLQNPKLEIGLQSRESGLGLVVEPDEYVDGFYPRALYLLAHPEYRTETLRDEFLRDQGANSATPLPKHYFPHDDAAHEPRNNWRHTAHLLFERWVETIYAATPHDRDDIPVPFSGKG